MPGPMSVAKRRRARRCVAKISVFLVGATALGGCSLSLGAAGTRAWSAPTSNHVGVTTKGWLALPKEYRYVAGFEASILGQTSPSIASDQWRVGPVGGYSVRPETANFGWEVLARAQLMRGSQGTFNGVGFVFGTEAGFPFQFSKREPWNEQFSSLRQYIVPSIGLNGVIGNHQSIHPELTLTLAYRFEFITLGLP